MPRIVFALLCAFALTACGGSDSTGPVPVSQVVLNRTTANLAVGDSVLLTATLRDASGSTLSDRSVSWASTNGGVASVSNTGWVKALSSGTTKITATAENITAEADITVASTPVISAVSPALLTPGITATITGSGFSANAAANVVRIAGATATITAASPTQLTITVPAAAALPCKAAHHASVAVTVANVTGSTTHPLEMAAQQSLDPGESISFPNATAARCNEFSLTGGRYFVTVTRPDISTGVLSTFRLTGEGATLAAPKVAPAVALPTLARAQSAGPGLLGPFAMVELQRREQIARRHHEMLEENLRVAARHAPALRRARPRGLPSLSRGRPSFAIANVGDTTEVKIPNRNLTGNTCTSAPIKVRARTVYSGTRAIVLEDVDAPFAGQQDSYYQALGQEFDAVMYPIVEQYFGDPLAYDAATDDNGKLLMLFSKQINDFGGILGFVTSCDFFDTLAVPQAVASNQAEIFYAIAPDESGTGITSGNGTYTVTEWRRIIRATLIHEAKHIAMFAERFANPNATTFETSWLEEGMAMQSEELYSRTITGATWRGNTGYGSQSVQNHIWCELRPSTCADRPFIMTSHFGFFYDYLTQIETRTIGGGIGTGDASFYGSSWAFLRWMLDAYATDEATVLGALTREPTLTGAANIEARTGLPFATLLAQFHYAVQYDDVAGVTPVAPWQHIASWNTRAIYAGLNTDLPQSFVADFLRDHLVQFGNFNVQANGMPGGTGLHLEISGPQSGRQSIALTALNGGLSDPALRLTVFRVQ